jgi:hypothetical protein
MFVNLNLKEIETNRKLKESSNSNYLILAQAGSSYLILVQEL